MSEEKKEKEIVELVCPNCGAIDEVPVSQEETLCDGCGRFLSQAYNKKED